MSLDDRVKRLHRLRPEFIPEDQWLHSVTSAVNAYRQGQSQFLNYIESIATKSSYHNTQTGQQMLEVGKVVVVPESRYFDGRSSFSGINATVRMDAKNLAISFQDSSGTKSISMCADRAIELGQLLLKAAETQSSYASASLKLQEEQRKLDEKYKELVSGTGSSIEIEAGETSSTIRVRR